MTTNQDQVLWTRIGDTFTGFSNMSPDYPLLINGRRIKSCEHLFHALKFPDRPDLQLEILTTATPMAARTLARKAAHKPFVRKDWTDIRLEVMRYCLRAKLIWNWVSFGRLLRESANRVILDNSVRTDSFWGVKLTSKGYEGENHLGLALMDLREAYLSEDNHTLHVLTPPSVELLLLGERLQTIDRSGHLLRFGTRKTEEVNQLRPDPVEPVFSLQGS